MTEAQAQYLVALFENAGYCVRKSGNEWYVWQPAADHVVEFDQKTLNYARDEAKSSRDMPA